MTDHRVQWARRLQSLAQTGLHYTDNEYDAERYEQIRRIAAEMMASETDASAEELERIFTAEAGPSTPKLDVRGACLRDGRILLVREAIDGKWAIPGGWADVNLSPSQNACREVREEAGFEVRADRLVYLRDKGMLLRRPGPFHAYTVCFLCTILSGEPRPDFEITEVGFFARGEVPPLSPGRTTEEDIDRVFAARRDPHLPVPFD